MKTSIILPVAMLTGSSASTAAAAASTSSLRKKKTEKLATVLAVDEDTGGKVNQRHLSGGKSGKASSGFATIRDYDWLVGTYTECAGAETATTALMDGKPYTTLKADCDDVSLEITRLQLDAGGDSNSFRAYYVQDTNVGLIRFGFYGVASFNPKSTDFITMRAEYIEKCTDGGDTWEPYFEGQHLESDADIMTLTRSENGKHIFAEYYSNTALGVHHVETISSVVWLVPGGGELE